MKITYSLIAGFFVWCLISSQWYLFGVKGIITDPAHFDSYNTTMAIIEILVMLLIAVLIGFGVAWFLQQSALDQQISISKSLQKDNYGLIKTHAESKELVQRNEIKLSSAQQTFREDLQNLTQEIEKITAGREVEKNEKILLVEELQMIRPKVQLADVELGRIAFQNKQLENQLTELKSANEKLNQRLKDYETQKSTMRKEPLYSDFIVGQRLGVNEFSEKDKDDLKHISGIGPVIEKKLNALGIFTFRQISEFTPDDINHVTFSIKFFPDRIGRDNWIGQAAALARYRKYN